MLRRRLLTPLQKFIQIESFSGMLLFLATLLALLWANSPYGHLYTALWDSEVGFRTEVFSLSKPLILWVNDGLMAIFFFLIGLEIKRELLIGELDSLRKAAFPFFAAVGGMIMPCLLFLLFNQNPATQPGWGIPMATDIAFALAILKILGDRVPLSLKVFLTAFAIIDDLGAVLVIAIFYSSGIKVFLLLYALLPLLLLALLSYRNYYRPFITLVLGVLIWVLFLKSGVHPTIAGVLIAFTIPIRQRVDFADFRTRLTKLVPELQLAPENKQGILSKTQIHTLDELDTITGEVQSPLQHLEHRLHNWVAYLIMPIFALTNAGVVFGGTQELDLQLVGLLVLCLIVGNSIGLTLMSWVGLKLAWSTLPQGMNMRHVIGAAFLAGVGFTMSIFVTNLAFADRPMLIASAKVGIIIGSTICGILGYLILRGAKPQHQDLDAL
ncbi:MAG: Na+/H+ antiporter NhaA [Bacteroidetes bacterium]|nr:MAG: Na+/H+ antiporter NhaA [Bacteroidota bacterium]